MTKVTVEKSLLEQALADLEHISTAAGQVEFIDKTCQKLRAALAEPAVEQDVAWGVDWGSHGERSCVSIIKKHANGVWEVVASEYGPAGSAITSPRAAPLEDPAVEPVAWMTFDGEGGYDLRLYDMNESYRDGYIKRNGEKYASWVQPLYASPPPAEVPMLTNEEFESIRKTCAYQFAEACRSGTTKAKTIMQATEAAVRQKAGL